MMAGLDPLINPGVLLRPHLVEHLDDVDPQDGLSGLDQVEPCSAAHHREVPADKVEKVFTDTHALLSSTTPDCHVKLLWDVLDLDCAHYELHHHSMPEACQKHARSICG